jgi:uncharacterized protein YfbU (UPF0304 family)
VAKEAAPFGTEVEFRGFDGNNEATHLSIAHFFVDKMERFSRFKGRDLNSHMPTIAGYRRMLVVFERMRQSLTMGREFDVGQIVAILSAQRHPSGV